MEEGIVNSDENKIKGLLVKNMDNVREIKDGKVKLRERKKEKEGRKTRGRGK